MEEVDPEIGLTYDNFVKKFKRWMKDNALSQRMVAPALCVSQGHLCDLLAQNKSTSWTMISKEGRKPYLRMEMLMNDKVTLEAMCRNPKLFSGESEAAKHQQNENKKGSGRFTPYQKKSLEKAYQLSNYPSKLAYQGIAEAVGLSNAQVRTWFNNRRKMRTHGALVKESQEENQGDNGKVSIKVRNGQICATSVWRPSQLRENSSHPQETVIIPGSEVLLNSTLITHPVDGESCSKLCSLTGSSCMHSDSLVWDSSSTSGTSEDVKMQANLCGEQESKSKGESQNFTSGGCLTTASECTIKEPFLSVQEIVELINASSSGVAIPSVSIENVSNIIQGNSALMVEDRGSDIVEDETVSISPRSLEPEYENLSNLSETQLKFLQLAYEVHKFPSDDVVNALHVLTSVEKKDIENWFLEETLRETVS